MPSRSEGRGGLFKARAQRALYRYPRSAPIRTRSASRKFIWNALRANFEQTAPPSLREGSPPDSGGDSPIYTSCRKINFDKLDPLVAKTGLQPTLVILVLPMPSRRHIERLISPCAIL